MNFLISLLCFWGVFSTPQKQIFPQHEFHTSISEINYNPKSKAFEISLRVFWDDLEYALNQAVLRDAYMIEIFAVFSEKELKTNTKGKVKVVIDGSKKFDNLIEAYLKERFYFTAKNKKVDQNFIGKEIDEAANVVWLYISVPLKKVNDIKVKNVIFLEAFDDQVNILNFKYGEQKKTYLCRMGNLEHTLNF